MTTPTYGTELHKRRTRAGIGRYELAQAVGVSGQSIRDWEKGTRTPREANQRKIDAALDGFEHRLVMRLLASWPVEVAAERIRDALQIVVLRIRSGGLG